MEQTYFQRALSDFVYDVASGGAIRHLADLGYTVKQIQEKLAFPTPYERIRNTVWKHLLDTGVIFRENPAGAEEKVEYVREYNQYGKASFRRVIMPVAPSESRESCLLCCFGPLKMKDPERFKEVLGVLEREQAEYIEGLPWARKGFFIGPTGACWTFTMRWRVPGSQRESAIFRNCAKGHIWKEKRILCQEKTADSGTDPDRECVMNQKLENLLNLALETPEAERMRTDNLNVGFDGQSRTWELIVKYHGSLDGLQALGVSVEYLINSYAILTVPEGLVEAVSNIEEIEYVEKPKRYYYQDMGPAADSCMTQVTLRDPFLTGEGVLLAVLDSGIDYTRPEFQDGAGRTRILYLWDQTLRPEAGNGERQPPVGFAQGVEFSAEQINQALASINVQERYMLLPSVDTSGHGTAVAGIAAGCLPAYGSVGSRPGISGNGLAENPGIPGSQYRGAAPAASLLAVKLGLPGEEGFPRTTEIMRGVTYALQKAMELEMPLVINLSFGNTYGSHDGGSLLERFLDNAAEIGRSVICVGSGNEGNSAGHVAGNLFGEGNRAASGSTAGAFRGGGTSGAFGGSGAFGAMASPGMTGPGGTARPAEIQLAVAEYERSLSIQLWKNYSDVYRIYLRSPGGQEAPLPEPVEDGKYTLQLEQTQILVYLGKPLPYAAAQEIYLELIMPAATAAPGPGMADAAAGGRQYINSGVWTIRIEPVQTVTGQYYLYLPSYAARSSRTGFYQPTPQVTLTIPSTAAKVITVGAYDSTYDSYADFSGRGYVDAERTIGVISAGLVKPDLAAPGVGILAPDLYGGYSPFTGTSFATPIVSGAAALLMEWGEGVIIRSR